jgi:transglutaminase-like putative cysteine protease
MRKQSIVLGFIVLGIALSSCESLKVSLDSMGTSIAQAASGIGGGNGSGGGLASVLSKNYTLPVSYETAYSYRTDTPDQNMKSIPKNIDSSRAGNPDEYVRRVVELINSSAKNDFEKVKKAHDIVALLVKYDAAHFWAGTVPDQSYRTVLKTGMAVCEGYSNTFKQFCDELNIPCEIVHGFGRGVGTSPLSGDTPNDSNHAWNIVTINGENYLVDCTWDSGYMDGRVSKQRYTTDWLFLKPEHFLYMHYPENAKQQLVAEPLSAEQFSALPFFKPKFFELADNLSVNLQKINQVDNRLSFDYTTKDGYWLNFRINDIKSGKQIENRDFVQVDGTKATAYFSFPSAGMYSVNIFWWKTGAKQGEGCGEFVVEASSSSPVQYPTTYSSSAKKLQIISPIEMPLKKGGTYTFRIGVDNKKIVAIIYGSTFVPLTKGNDGIFTAEFEIPPNIKELSIGIADSEQGRYESIARYTVN